MTKTPSDPPPLPSGDDAPAAGDQAERHGAIDPRLLAFLVCPLTKGPLRVDAEAGELVSEQAGLAYPIRDGIPIMLESEARSLDSTPEATRPGAPGPAES